MTGRKRTLQYQIAQLSKFEPETAADAASWADSYPAKAAKIAVAGLKRALDQLNKPPTVAEALAQAAATGQTKQGESLSPAVKGRKLEITPGRWIFCDHRGDWRLFNPGGTSPRVLYWGRDDDNISSSQAGKWKVVDR